MGENSLRSTPAGMTISWRCSDAEARGEEGRRGVVVRGDDDGVGGTQDERQHETPMPLEQARLPVHADDIHLILQHQARSAEPAPGGEQLGRAEERIVQVEQVEAAGAGDDLRQAGGVAAPEQRRQLDHVDARRSQARRRAVRGEHRDVDAGRGQGARLVISHRTHAAPVGGKTGAMCATRNASTYTGNRSPPPSARSAELRQLHGGSLPITPPRVRRYQLMRRKRSTTGRRVTARRARDPAPVVAELDRGGFATYASVLAATGDTSPWRLTRVVSAATAPALTRRRACWQPLSRASKIAPRW